MYLEEYLNQLLDKFNDYKSITNYCIEYILEDCSVIRFQLKQSDFPHLLGLHKLIDIPVIRQFNDKKNIVVGAKYILFEKKGEGYHHLCVAEDKTGDYYIESFFYQPTNLYLCKQKIMKIESIKIYDKAGNLYLEDIL